MKVIGSDVGGLHDEEEAESSHDWGNEADDKGQYGEKLGGEAEEGQCSSRLGWEKSVADVAAFAEEKEGEYEEAEAAKSVTHHAWHGNYIFY